MLLVWDLDNFEHLVFVAQSAYYIINFHDFFCSNTRCQQFLLKLYKRNDFMLFYEVTEQVNNV